MLALTTALLTAILAIVGKVVSDLWQRDQERRGLAGALAGEIGAYIEPYRGAQIALNMKMIADLGRSDRRRRLSGFSKLPEGHPVFDALASKLGLLPPNTAKRVASFYNTTTSLRLLMENFSRDGFLDADDQIQRGQLFEVGRLVDNNLLPAENLVDELVKLSERGFLTRKNYRK